MDDEFDYEENECSGIEYDESEFDRDHFGEDDVGEDDVGEDDDGFDYEEYIEREFGEGPPPRTWHHWVAVLLLVVFLFLTFGAVLTL